MISINHLKTIALGLALWSHGVWVPGASVASADQATVLKDFNQAVESDLLISRAQAAARLGQDDEARQLFAKAREAKPDSAEIWHQSAQFELTRSKFEEALAFLERAMTLAPTEQAFLYDKIYALISLQRDDEATLLLNTLRLQKSKDVRAEYYLGLLAVKHNEWESAKTRFERVKESPDSIAAYAKAFYAVCLQQLGDDKSATVAAKEALVSAPTEEWRKRLSVMASTPTPSVKKAVVAGASDEKSAEWFFVRGMVAFEFDSNVTLTPNNAANIASIGPVKKALPGGRMVTNALVLFRPVDRPYVTLELEGQFVNATHLNNRKQLGLYDYGGIVATVREYTQVGKGKIKGDFGLDFTFRDLYTNAYQSHLMTAYQLLPHAGVFFNERHFLMAYAAFEYRDFITGNPVKSERSIYDRDGWVYGATLAYQVPVSIVDFVLNLGYDQEKTAGQEYALLGAHGQFMTRVTIKKKITLDAQISFNARAYNQALLPRLEQRFEVGANVRWDIMKYCALKLGYSYMQNDASLFSALWKEPYDLFAYRRHLVSLGFLAWY